MIDLNQHNRTVNAPTVEACISHPHFIITVVRNASAAERCRLELNKYHDLNEGKVEVFLFQSTY